MFVAMKLESFNELRQTNSFCYQCLRAEEAKLYIVLIYSTIETNIFFF